LPPLPQLDIADPTRSARKAPRRHFSGIFGVERIEYPLAQCSRPAR
jgi:hypothetical protein